MTSKKRFILVLIIITFCSISHKGNGQELGVSFSYFLPRDGYFSVPISPISLRGIGFDLHRYFSIETGFTLYRMSGMNVKGLPFKSKKPLIGPNFTLLIPLEGVIQFVGQTTELRFKGGGFTYFSFDNKIIEGNMDRALLNAIPDLEVVNSNLNARSKIGLGIEFGGELVVYFARQFGVSLGANYFIGDSDLALKGEYTGGSTINGIETVPIEFPGSKLDFTGFEISLGVIFSNQ